MSDKARDWTDEQLDDLTSRFERAYSQAADEMRAKLEVSLKGYATENEQRQKAMDNTPEARAEYEAWKSGQVADQAWMRQMVDMLSDGAHNANRLAADMTNDAIPRIYSENANMQAFALESRLGYDVGFTLVNEDAVRYLIGLPLQKAGDDQLLREVTWNPDPERSHVQDLRKREVDYPSDMRWNRQKFTSAITQGILQGESIPNIVKRTSSIYGMNKNAATRAARTSVTNAENAGRMNAFERAQRLGIDMEIEWLATLDGRTRSSHRVLDGERIQLGEKFSNGLRWPADPYGAPSEVWGCRCRANGRVVGFDGKRGDWADEQGERWARLPKGMTYDEWKKAKAVSREESYKNPSSILSGFWNDAHKQASNHVETWPTSAVEDIGMKPTRPRRGDFDSRDEYLAARDEYRTARDEFKARKQQFVDEIVSRPSHGYETESAVREWAERRNVVVQDKIFEIVDPRLLDEIVYVNDRLMDKYPQVMEMFDRGAKKYGERGKFTIYTLEDDSCSYSANGGLEIGQARRWSYREHVKNTIDQATMPTYNEELGRTLREMAYGDGTPRTTIAHEYGHNLDFAIRDERFNYFAEDAADVDEASLKRFTTELEEMTKAHTTSQYSLFNHSEAFAEGFAEMECNPASEYGKAFSKFLERWL